jgi:hypothetical protein
MARTLYMQELESVRQDLIYVGETTIALLTEATKAVSGRDGDYAYEIVTLSGSAEHRPPHPIMSHISEIGSRTREIL